MQIQILDKITGRNEKIRVSFKNLKVRSCGKEDHPKKYAYPDFGSELNDEIFWGETSPTSKTNVYLNLTSQRKCCSCKNIIEERLAVNEELTFDLNIERVPELELSIKGPVLRCRSCGVKQIIADEDTSFKISEAIVDAFDKVNLNP
ncbi:MAG: hypothetical protein U5K69_25215 [Balneolaceae bacterium]|nr:hypothetical protein [Balneolaceae bacterium]